MANYPLDSIATKIENTKTDSPLSATAPGGKYNLQTIATEAPTKESPKGPGWMKGSYELQSPSTTVNIKPTPRQAYDNVSYSQRAMAGKKMNGR